MTIRRSVFETNSSSTHSLTIRTLQDEVNNIPEGVTLDICEEIVFIGNCSMVSEMEKLRYMVQMVVLYMDFEANYDYFGTDYHRYWGDSAKEGWKKYKKNILEFPWLVWLNEVVQEERNTTLVYDLKVTEFPYISEHDSFEDNYVWEVLGLSRKDCNDKEKVKNLFRNIIFNPAIVLEDRVDEY